MATNKTPLINQEQNTPITDQLFSEAETDSASGSSIIDIISTDKATLESSYWLDDKHRIIKVGGGWDDFAKQNDGSEALLKNNIEGELIWDFISGTATYMWFDTILNFAKITQEPIERFYRCDSPTLKRQMKMHISYQKHALCVSHQLISVQAHTVPVHLKGFHANATSRKSRLPLRCSSCGRIKQDDQWFEPSALTSLSNPASKDEPFKVIYTICPSCRILFPHGNNT